MREAETKPCASNCCCRCSSLRASAACARRLGQLCAGDRDLVLAAAGVGVARLRLRTGRAGLGLAEGGPLGLRLQHEQRRTCRHGLPGLHRQRGDGAGQRRGHVHVLALHVARPARRRALAAAVQQGGRAGQRQREGGPTAGGGPTAAACRAPGRGHRSAVPPGRSIERAQSRHEWIIDPRTVPSGWPRMLPGQVRRRPILRPSADLFLIAGA
jgi:hypothetical protein